jgi:hypothetical protein
LKSLAPDTLRIAAATATVLALGAVGSHIPMPSDTGSRIAATAQMVAVSFMCMAGIWPALRLTRAVSEAESRALLAVLTSIWNKS